MPATPEDFDQAEEIARWLGDEKGEPVRFKKVEPGDDVRPGQRIALASDSNAPDGCHLHFEVRAQGGGVSDAVDPAPLLQLSR